MTSPLEGDDDERSGDAGPVRRNPNRWRARIARIIPGSGVADFRKFANLWKLLSGATMAHHPRRLKVIQSWVTA